MYFWTNTPNQSAFIELSAEVNRLNAYINDPNVDEAQAQIYQIQFIAAKAKMFLRFLLVNSDWEEWLFANNFDTPQMGKNGWITAYSFERQFVELVLVEFGQDTLQSGQTYYWNDFYRMLALRAFLLRSAPGSEKGQYHPEHYFNEEFPEAP